MQGYWGKKEATAEVFDAEGWFHTGDIGRFERGYLKITDRLKNMLKTSLGKNIYPTQIENVLLRSPRLEQVFIIGDKKEFLTAIIKFQNIRVTKRIKDFIIKREPFSVEAGDMTITLKVKRKVVMEKYNEQIEAMYV